MCDEFMPTEMQGTYHAQSWRRPQRWDRVDWRILASHIETFDGNVMVRKR